MPLETIACNNCGAPLEIPAGANFITCNFCHTSLAVHRGDSTSYTEIIAKVDDRTRKMAGELAQLRYNQELERIDREWEAERQTYLSKDKNGNAHEPTTFGAVLIGAIAIIFGIFWTCSSAAFGGFGNGPGWLGIVFALFGVGFAIHAHGQAIRFSQARDEYQQRRDNLSLEQFLPDDMKSTPSVPQATSGGDPLAFLKDEPDSRRRISD